MCTMVDILSAEVPPIDLEDLFLASGLDSQLLSPDLNAMGGLDGLVEGLAPDATAELSLPDAAVAEHDLLHLVLGLGSKVELGKVGAQPWEAVVVFIIRENLPRHTDHLVGNKFGQARAVCEDPNERGRDRKLAVKEA